METKTSLIQFSFFCLSALFSLSMTAQDTIQKTNGEYVFGKVIEVGVSTVSYKKKGFEDGPTYTEELKTIGNIRYKGRRDDYKKGKIVSSTGTSVPTVATKNPDTSQPNSSTGNEKLPDMMKGTETMPVDEKKPKQTDVPTAKLPSQEPLQNGPVSNQYRIEHLDKKFMVNGQKVSSKAVDKLLAKSTNPSVVALAGSAKLLKTFQKVSKLAAYPSTIGGGVASIGTFSRMYKQVKDGGASPAAIKDFALSFAGTMTLPITSKILKNRRDKMYDKAIDLYNFRN